VGNQKKKPYQYPRGAGWLDSTIFWQDRVGTKFSLNQINSSIAAVDTRQHAETTEQVLDEGEMVLTPSRDGFSAA
jgi:hypothetical protein